MGVGICAALGVVENLYPKQNYSNIARSFDRWIPSAEIVLATSTVKDFVDCFVLKESFDFNLEIELNQNKAMGYSFPMGRFTRVKRCVKIPEHLSEII